MAGALIFQNGFGQVFSDRVVFNVRRAWFGGEAQEDFALRHITSVRAETIRNVGGALVLIIIGVICLSIGGGVALLGLIAIGFGIVLLIGNPAVTIVTAGGERRMSFGSFSQKPAATEFANAVRKALFD